jgi:hypothetical protein
MLTGEVQSDQALGHVAVVALLGFTQLDSGCLTPSQGLLEPLLLAPRTAGAAEWMLRHPPKWRSQPCHLPAQTQSLHFPQGLLQLKLRHTEPRWYYSDHCDCYRRALEPRREACNVLPPPGSNRKPAPQCGPTCGLPGPEAAPATTRALGARTWS